MADLVLRPSGLSDPRKAWSLQLRHHDPAETNYHTIARVPIDVAREIIAAGGAYFLFGEPDEAEREPTFAEFVEVGRLNRMAALKAERADLAAANEKAEAWGAAVGARCERIAEIDGELARIDNASLTREIAHG